MEKLARIQKYALPSTYLEPNTGKSTNLIIWEIHGFCHEFHIVRENETKLTVWGEPVKLVLILLP